MPLDFVDSDMDVASNAATQVTSSLILANDFLTILVHCSGFLASSPSGPSGFSSPYTIVNGTYNKSYLYYKVADGDEETIDVPNHITFSGTNTSTLFVHRGGYDTASPIVTYSSTSYITSNTALRAATVTPVDANSPVLMIGHSALAGSVMTCSAPSSPGTWAEDHDNYVTLSYNWSSFCYRSFQPATPTGIIEATLSASSTVEKAAFALVLRPLDDGAKNIIPQIAVSGL